MIHFVYRIRPGTSSTEIDADPLLNKQQYDLSKLRFTYSAFTSPLRRQLRAVSTPKSSL
jgi:hypothetical protein